MSTSKQTNKKTIRQNDKRHDEDDLKQHRVGSQVEVVQQHQLGVVAKVEHKVVILETVVLHVAPDHELRFRKRAQ